jgi:hypothetical protein
MANTDVVLRDEMGMRVPNIPKVTISSGDSVTFAVEEGADSALYFSPETASILSPTPGARVDLPSGHSLTYTFAAPAPSAYGVVTQAPEDPAPGSFDFGPPAEPPVLVIQPGNGLPYPGPVNPIQT